MSLMMLVIASVGARADDYIIPGVQRDLGKEEYRLAWALMSFNAVYSCYTGTIRAIDRAELTTYENMVREIQNDVVSRDPRVDPHLTYVDVMRGSNHPFVTAREPIEWVCNSARINIGRIYYDLFPARCPTAGGCGELFEACPALRNERSATSKFDLCPDSEIERLKRGAYLPSPR
jgi:hypothetical protein